ncbi:MAG: ribosome maturation factor RimP [Chitinispirillales bacterium]|jgi:ribosome maturation factor RimP|nr:ribosome maturation factor RimP [Chitinispirillales bacterium]
MPVFVIGSFMASFERVKPQIEAKIEELGLEFFDARFFGSGQRSVLRVTVDLEAGGVSIADCERVSKALGAMLDEQGFFDGKPYTLEVSSPGIDRPLKTERDFKRIVGKNVVVNLEIAINGKKSLRGAVLGCENEILSISAEKGSLSIPLADILSGKEEIRFK